MQTVLVFFSVSWERDHGTAWLKNTNRSLVVEPITLSMLDDRIVGAVKAQLPLSYFARVAGIAVSEDDLYGECVARLLLNVSDVRKGIHGNITVTNVRYAKYPLCEQAQLSFSRNNAQWKGGLRLTSGNTYRIAGSWQFDQDQGKGSAQLNNSSNLQIPLTRYWDILPQDATIKLVFDAKKVTGSYRCRATNKVVKSTAEIAGTLELDSDLFSMHGQCNGGRFDGAIRMQPHIALQQFTYHDINDTPCIVMREHTARRNALTGKVQVPFLRELLRDTLGYDVQGHGVLSVSALIDKAHMAAKVSLVDGTIRLPHTYNFINGFDAIISADWVRKKLTIREASCRLNRGFVACERAGSLDNYVLYFVQQAQPTDPPTVLAQK